MSLTDLSSAGGPDARAVAPLWQYSGRDRGGEDFGGEHVLPRGPRARALSGWVTRRSAWSQWNLVAMGTGGFLLKLFKKQNFHWAYVNILQHLSILNSFSFSNSIQGGLVYGRNYNR